MAIYLECLFDPHRGRHLPIAADRPAVIKTQKSDQGVGEVRVELVDGSCVLENRSRMICLVNGAPQQRQVLAHGDEITIGKQHFRLVRQDDEAETTEHIKRDPVKPKPALCSACDGPFDARNGWSRGDQRLCRSCLGKGVKPDHLPRSRPQAGESGPRPVPPPTYRVLMPDEIEVIEPPSAVAAPGATANPDATTATVVARSESDSDRQRRIRRISASQQAQVGPPKPTEKPNLLQKVSQVFALRDERRRLETLEQERTDLLLLAGRAALVETGGFGLPEGCLSPLVQGQPITLRLQDLVIASLEQWRIRKERLACLDVEITALRKMLGLGPDPSLAIRAPDNLRAERQVNQERTFQILDEIGTEDIGAAVDPADLVAPAPRPATERPAAVSGRRKPPLRRRG